MKLNTLLAALIGAIAINGVVAGDCYAPTSGKCPVECSPDAKGHISIGYDSDYILYGVRHLRDNVWADVNYTFDGLPVPVTVGARQITGLGSTADNNWDESDLYASVELPSFFGFTSTIGYIHRFYPNLRGPSGTNNAATLGDSRGELWFQLDRELFCGVNAFYRRAYDRNMPSALSPLHGNTEDNGAWVHTLGLEKSFCITDNIGLDLSGGVLYSDNYWPATITQRFDNTLDHDRSSGWNSYYIRAALPIALGCKATLTPYVRYNGSPDSWLADGVDLLPTNGNNANDIFSGGVSVTVDF